MSVSENLKLWPCAAHSLLPYAVLVALYCIQGCMFWEMSVGAKIMDRICMTEYVWCAWWLHVVHAAVVVLNTTKFKFWIEGSEMCWYISHFSWLSILSNVPPLNSFHDPEFLVFLLLLSWFSSGGLSPLLGVILFFFFPLENVGLILLNSFMMFGPQLMSVFGVSMFVDSSLSFRTWVT